MTKTVLDLTPDERLKYRPAKVFEHRQKEEDGGIKLRRWQAWDIAKRAAKLLRKEFSARKVAVFGSLVHVHDKRFGFWSDIDLAAWEIPPEEFFSAVAAVSGLSPSFRIALVDVGECRPGLLKVIEQEGIEI